MDGRVPFSPALAAFGVPATVTRPEPGAQAVTTTGFWVTPLAETTPIGTDFQRREPRRVIVFPRDGAVPEIVRNTLVVAPEMQGQANRTWRVDGLELVEPDCVRAIVVPE
jgi:hypothetical protein